MVPAYLDSSSEGAATASSPHRLRLNHARAPTGDLQSLDTEVNDRASSQHPHVQQQERQGQAAHQPLIGSMLPAAAGLCKAQRSAADPASRIL